MTAEEAKKMLKAKLECLKNETSGINHDCNMRLCDGCSLNYEQGNMGEQKEALDMAIKALEQQQDKVIHNHPCEDCYYNDGDIHAECVVCDKPLEQQPCEDCVSRNHMIDVIKGKIADVSRNANGTYQRDNGMFVNGLHRALELVLNAPSIAPSRPQGEWEIFRDCEGKTRVCICKICGHKTGKYQWTNPNFCENCGADMRGD